MDDNASIFMTCKRGILVHCTPVGVGDVKRAKKQVYRLLQWDDVKSDLRGREVSKRGLAAHAWFSFHRNPGMQMHRQRHAGLHLSCWQHQPAQQRHATDTALPRKRPLPRAGTHAHRAFAPHPQVYVLWPENSTWYLAEVVSIRVRALRASLHYPETVEEEDADLAELIGEGQVAFSELGEGGCT